MMEVTKINAFYRRLYDNTLILTFAYDNINIVVNGERFKFIPTRKRDVFVDILSGEIKNKNDEFAFKTERRVIYLSLDFLCNSNTFKNFIIDSIDPFEESSISKEEKQSVDIMLKKLSLLKAIDNALDNNDKVLFLKFSKNLNDLECITNEFS